MVKPGQNTFISKELISRISDGDEQAFAQFYQELVVQLRPFIFKLTRSEDMVDGFIQETFLRVWLNRDKLETISDPKAWVFKISANLCNTWLKRMLLERKIINQIQGGNQELAEIPAEHTHLNALKNTVREAVNNLSPQRKTVYLLSREQGMTITQIAEQMDLSPNTVRNTLSSSLGIIREFLEKKGYLLSILLLLISFC